MNRRELLTALTAVPFLRVAIAEAAPEPVADAAIEVYNSDVQGGDVIEYWYDDDTDNVFEIVTDESGMYPFHVADGVREVHFRHRAADGWRSAEIFTAEILP